MPEPADQSRSSPIRVLLWSPRGSGTHYYGPGSFSYRLYASAAAGRFDVTLAHGFAEQADYDLFTAQHFIAPLPEFNEPLRTRWWRTRRFCAAAEQFLHQRADEFDVFHGLTGFITTLAPARAAEHLGLPAAAFIANHRIDLHDTAPLQRVLRLARRRQRIARRISAVIAMSSAIADELRSYGIDETRIARIPMAVDTDRFRPARDDAERSAARQQLGWPDRPTLLFTGRVGRRKRPHLLIEAVAAAEQAGLDTQAVIAGPANDAAYVREMNDRAAALGVTDRVIHAGFHEDPAPLYRAADAFALPSASEGMPAAVVEAMASGLPAIVTAISGCEDLVRDGADGRIIEPTAEHIGGAWIEYVRDQSLRKAHGETARAGAVEQYSTAVVLDAYEALFRTIMAGRNR